MGTTDSNGVYFYEETDPVSPLHTLLNVGQQSISDAIGDQFVSSNTEPAAVAGLRWFQPTTNRTYISDGTTWYYVGGGTRFWMVDAADSSTGAGGQTTICTQTITAAPKGVYDITASVLAWATSVLACNIDINIGGTDVYSPRNDAGTTGTVQTHKHYYTHTGGDLTIAVQFRPTGGTGNIRGSGTRLTIALI